jgi:hypothetical protein
MKKNRLALYITPGDTTSKDARVIDDWADGSDGYIRVSEFHDVEFEMRPSGEFVPEQVKQLRAKGDKIRKDASEKLQLIEDAIHSLEAIEYIPGD